ncbi:MAG: hypothetical protein HRU38_03820 [Saccharospirillaceae bacterium]|nr:hypothetical protein [Pseudomonadales bacterium]NRB77792.1 hypothetical protein [Saccharospirillaceae bacterium]
MKYLLLMLSCFLLVSCDPESKIDEGTLTKDLTETGAEFGQFLSHNNPKSYKLNKSIDVEYLEGVKFETEIIEQISEINFNDGYSYNDDISFYDYGLSGLPGTWEKIGSGYQLTLVDDKEIGAASFEVASDQAFNYVVFEFNATEISSFSGYMQVAVEMKSNEIVIRSSEFVSPIIYGDKYLIPFNLLNEYKNISITLSFSSENNEGLIVSLIDAVTYNFTENEIKNMMKINWIEGAELSNAEAVSFINGVNVDVDNVMASKSVKDFSYIGYSLDDGQYEVDVRMFSDEQYLYYYFSKMGEEFLWFELKVDLDTEADYWDFYHYDAVYTDLNSIMYSNANINKDILKLNSYINISHDSVTSRSSYPVYNDFLNKKVELDRIQIEEVSNVSKLTNEFHLSSGVINEQYVLNLEEKDDLINFEFSENTQFISNGIAIDLPLMTGVIEVSFDAEVDIEGSECYLSSNNKFKIVGQDLETECINKNATYSMIQSVNNDDRVYFGLTMTGGSEFIDNYYQIKIDNIRVSVIKASALGWETTWDLRRYSNCDDIPFKEARLTIQNDMINGVILNAQTNDTSELQGTFIDTVINFNYQNVEFKFKLIDDSGLYNGSGVIFEGVGSDCNLIMNKYIP